MNYKHYELHIEKEGRSYIVEMSAVSAEKAIRYYADSELETIRELENVEHDDQYLDVIVTDKSVSLVYARALVGSARVDAALEVEDRRDYEK